MWVSTVSMDNLRARARWKVEFFCEPEFSEAKGNQAGFVRIGDLLRERRESVDPRALGKATVNYIGLENIHSGTGELVGFSPRPADSVKSRSKVFQAGDVLFGRLRPNLNKVWLAGPPVTGGICSTEFYVLIPDESKVRPIVLRYLISSEYVQRHAVRFQTGTALPRMNLDDLLDIQTPLPDMDVQKSLERDLREQFKELVALRKRVEELPAEVERRFLQAIGGGSGS